MGLFSNKKEERIRSNGLNIPMPPETNKQNPGNFGNSSSRFKDDFERPFDINQPISEQIRQNPIHFEDISKPLIPTMLGPENNLDLRLPSFSTKSNHNLDLDAIEKELSIPPEKKEKEQTPESKSNSVQTMPDENHNIDEKIIKASLDNIRMPAEKQEEDGFDIDEIPDEIEGIPDFIPELDIEEQMLSETAAFIEEPKEKKSAYIGINSIISIKKNSGEIKTMLSQIAEGTGTIEDNDQNQQELLTRSRALFEDVERKILFINKALFSEE